MSLHYQTVDSPLGTLRLWSGGGALLAIDFPGQGAGREDAAERTDEVLDACARQLREYFSGERRDFELPLAPAGTAFQQQVWACLREIPYGTLRSYRDVAAAIGRPRAVRAVGAANGRNPLPIVVPCHRVIGSDGSLTGYAGGLARKQFLLRLEGAA